MADIATCEVTLPTAPAQAIPQAKRMVTVAGSLVSDGTQTVLVDAPGPIVVTAAMDPNGKVAIEVVEVLANGRQSAPCRIEFTPYALVEAVAADPSGFRVKVTPVADATPIAANDTGPTG
jgi:hypothetical protein